MKIGLVAGGGRTSQEIAGYCRSALQGLGHETDCRIYALGRWAQGLLRPLAPAARRWQTLKFETWLHRWRPDIVIVVKGEEMNPEEIVRWRRATGVPWINWWIDDPGLLKVSLGFSPCYDLFLTNDPASVEAHRRAGARKADCLTFAHDPRVHRRRELSPEERGRFVCDVTFAGRLTPQRAELLAPLVPLGLTLWAEPRITRLEPDGSVSSREISGGDPLRRARRGDFVWGGDLAALYSASKICVNIHSHGSTDANMRVFEATACGTLLITEDRPLVRELFQARGPQAEIVVYSGKEDLVRQVRYYLIHDDERAAIAARGMARCRREYSYEARMKRLLELAKSIPS